MNVLKTTAFAFVASGLSASASAGLINEFQPNPPGAEPDELLIELVGTAGASFSGFLTLIEDDGINGEIDRSNEVTGVFDSNGLAVVTIPDLENPSFTFLFSSLNGGGLGVDLDAEDDGFIDDITVFGTIFDAIGIADDAAELLYASQLGGVNFFFTGDEPGLVFRDGLDPTTIFAINDPAGDFAFDQFGNQVALTAFDLDPVAPTFGSVNPTVVPEPASLALVALGGVALMGRRRTA